MELNINAGTCITILLVIFFLAKSSWAITGSFVVGSLGPELNASYPNQTWNMNNDKTGPDLDGYFNDPNGDILNYSASTADNPNINVTIESDNTVTFAPTGRWNGTEHVTFTASDGTNTVNSNNVTLQVNYTSTAPTILTYTPSSSPTITEEQNQTFTISFTDAEDDNITVTWTLNGTTELQETKLLSSGNSYTNSSSYAFVSNYSRAGTYVISVSASDGALSTTLPIGSWTLTVSNVNRAPYFNRSLTNLSVIKGTTQTTDTLDNYVVDPDLDIDDSLSFSYITVDAPSSIRVKVNPITHEVTFNPFSTFTGKETVYFKVTDSVGDFNYSNNISIVVTALDGQSATTPPANSEGARTAECESYWYCNAWSRCDPKTNTRTRSCDDLAECRIIYYVPPTEEDCEYIPTCYDKIKNNGEDEVDCGGPCPPCWTCYDGIKNQEEEGIDCGGPCKECATCDDGKKNCHRIDKDTLICEEDVDCGGPCKECEQLSPERSSVPVVIGAIASIALLGLLGSMFIFKFKIKHIKLNLKKKEKPHIEEHHIKIGDMSNIEKELNKVGKLIKTLPKHEVIKILSALVNRVINHKYNIATYYTQKELADKMANIKGDTIIKEILLHIHSKLYHYKFSGENAPEQELQHYMKQIKAINRLERQKLIDENEGKYDEKLKNLFKMYLKRDYYIDQADTEKAEELTRTILKKEKDLSQEERRKVKFLLSHEDEVFVEHRMGIEKHDNHKAGHNHNLKAVAVILILATALFFTFSSSDMFKGGFTGFVVLDGNETVEPTILCNDNLECGNLAVTNACDELVYFTNTITPTCNDAGTENSSCENVSSTEQEACNNICDDILGCDYTQCSDTLDNDEDGNIDLDDAGCDDSLDDDESDEVAEEEVLDEEPGEEPAEEEPEDEIVEEELGDDEGDYGTQGDYGILGASGPPVFVTPTDGQVLTFAEDNDSSYLIQGTSEDGDYPLDFSFSSQQQTGGDEFVFIHGLGLTIVRNNDSSAWVNFTPTETYVYDSNKVAANYTITITLTDSAAGVANRSASINVVWNISNTNDAPSIVGQDPAGTTATVAEAAAKTFSFTNSSSDPDFVHPGLEVLTITWIFNGTSNETNQSSYTTKAFGYCEAGTYNVTLNVTDSGGLFHNITWLLTVSNNNRAPEVNKTFDGYDYINWTEGGNITNNITLSQYFNDTDTSECSGTNQDTVTYGYEVLSTTSVNNSKHVNVSINQTDWVVSYYSPADWYGVEVIRFFANDSYDLTYSDKNITLNVTNTNDAPVLTAISNQNATANSLFTYQVIANDPDNDTLTYGDNSTLFNVSSSTGLISFTPTADQADQNYSITVNVTDPSGLSDSVVFNLTINLENRLPNITTIYPYGTPLSSTTVFAFASVSSFPGDITSINLSEGTTVIFNHTSTDPDGNPLRCLWYFDGTLKENNSCSSIPNYNYTINYTQAGLKNITLVVDDQQNTTDTTDRFTWNTTVTNTNRAPKFAKTLSSESDFTGGTITRTNITKESGNITLGQLGENYYYNGTYLSPAITMEATGHSNINITSISWTETKPANTNISFKVRIATTSAGLTSASWTGPYSTSTGNAITYVNGGYIQFEINMTTTDTSATPTVEDVTINYTIRDADITGGYSSWMDIREFFNDEDTDDTLTYSVDYISGASVMNISIDSGIVALSDTNSDGIVIFRFIANDSYLAAYSNNITLTVEVEADDPVTTTVTSSSSGGGGGGSSSPKVKIITEQQPYYLQLINVNPVEVLPDNIVKVPIVLRNDGNSTLSEITLSAQSAVSSLSFEFLSSYVSLLDIGSVFETELYVKSTQDITSTYSIEITADVAYPGGKDVATVTINPLSNLTEKVNKVMDMIKLNPICRELEEIVVKAQEAMQNKRYDEADALLTEAIEGCKYLISASQTNNELLAPKKDFVLTNKWIYVSVGAIVLILLLSYFIPILINKVSNVRFSNNKKKHKKK